MKILDRYITKKFLGTLGFMLVLLSIIVILIDVQSKSPRIEKNGFTVGYFLIHFYPYWLVYLVITFMSILVFISVIYFTSRLANDTEIVAYISSGTSFHRFAKPYFVSALFLVFCSLLINHFALPWANTKKNELIVFTFTDATKEKLTSNTPISSRLSVSEYVFINSYNRHTKYGSGYKYQKFDTHGKLVHQILASDIFWDEQKKIFRLNNYFERKSIAKDREVLLHGTSRTQDFKQTPEELFPDRFLAENKSTPELLNFIDREEKKGNSTLNAYLNVLHQRTSMPVSILILTFLALSLSSQKRRGGIGVSLALGISLAFVFIFSFEVLKIVAENKVLPPLLAMWLPNIVFGILTAHLYVKRVNA